MKIASIVLLGTLVASLASASARAADGTPFDIGSKFQLVAPADWESKEPRSRIVEYEFATPAAEGESVGGRVTVMGAGGGVDANIDRWKGQFKSDGAEVKADVKKQEVAGQEVHVVDIKGTYLDKPGPFVPGPGTEMPNYRMLGAIIVTKGAGQYFVKMYGPEKSIAAAQPGFQKMIDGLKAK
ncbi:MAG: hypothetical protein JNL96_06555 [Planctomycetaceae bacterium]|nr:hypothetical protein [Planctomycetaceae bacterium]